MTKLSEKVAKGLRDRREMMGWSQRELAERVGVSRVSVHHVETGSSLCASLDSLDRYAQAMGTSLVELLTDDASASPAAGQAAELVSSLAPHDQSRLLSMIRAYVGQCVGVSGRRAHLLLLADGMDDATLNKVLGYMESFSRE